MVVIKNAHSSDEESPIDVENASSADENQMEVDEGEVTEEQKKVAEAAGLGDQVSEKDNKKTRSEKKARRIFARLGLKQITGITKVCIRKSNGKHFLNLYLTFKCCSPSTSRMFLRVRDLTLI